MTVPARSSLESQVRRVHRRLFLQALLDRLAWCWAGALLLAAAWLLAQPLLTGESWDWLRWPVVGGLVLAASGLALLLAYLGRPSPVSAALAFDERFALRERVTTSLGLSPELRATPAGQALLEDATERVARLDVGSRFPLRMSWSAAAVPALGACLALVAVFYDPPRGHARPDDGNADVAQAPVPRPPQAQVEENKAFDDLDKTAEPQAGERDDDVKIFDDRMGKIARRPRETEEERQAREAELDKLERDLKQAEKDLAAQKDKVKDELKKDDPDRLTKKPKDGPAKDLQDAVNKGDRDEIKKEADRLAKKLNDKDNPLSDEDKKQLKEQLDDLQNDLERLSRKKEDEEKLLKDLHEKGQISKETLDRELDQIKKDKEQGEGKEKKTPEERLKDAAEQSKDPKEKEALEREAERVKQEEAARKELKDAADQVKKAEDALEKGDGEKAAEAVQKAGDKLDGEQAARQQEQIAERVQRVQRAREALKNNKGEGQDQGGPGKGARPSEKDDKTGFQKTRAGGNPDDRGRSEVVGDGPRSGKYIPKTPADIDEEVKQKAQQTGGPRGQQGKVSKEASESTKGYFENLGGQKK